MSKVINQSEISNYAFKISELDKLKRETDEEKTKFVGKLKKGYKIEPGRYTLNFNEYDKSSTKYAKVVDKTITYTKKTNAPWAYKLRKRISVWITDLTTCKNQVKLDVIEAIERLGR